jgi:hypothetical protein
VFKGNIETMSGETFVAINDSKQSPASVSDHELGEHHEPVADADLVGKRAKGACAYREK